MFRGKYVEKDINFVSIVVFALLVSACGGEEKKVEKA